jgi:hypothetical protein
MLLSVPPPAAAAATTPPPAAAAAAAAAGDAESIKESFHRGFSAGASAVKAEEGPFR